MPVLSNRRKQNFVNARVQGRLVARVAGYFLLGLFVLLHGLFLLRYALSRVTISEDMASHSARSLYEQFWMDSAPLVISALLILPVLLLEFVRMTHRVVGPLVRVQNALEALMQGEHVSDVKFRDNDLLNEFEDKFNKFLVFYERQRAAGGHPVDAGTSTKRDDQLTEAQASALSSVVAAPPSVAAPAGV